MIDLEQNKLNELHAKINNLEHENEVLSAKVEETLLLNKAFEEIGLYTDIDTLLNETLESISILLDIPITSLFDYKNKEFEYLNGFSLLYNLDGAEISISIPKSKLKTNLGSEFHFFNKPDSLIITGKDYIHKAACVGIMALNSVVHKNRCFVFASEKCTTEVEVKIPIIKKVVKVISRRLERIYFQNELQIVNKKLQSTNSSLNRKNHNLLLKNEIINSQNKELKETMENLRDAQAQLIESDKMASLGILTAGIAHEINNPLNYITGAHFGLVNYFKSLNEEPSADITLLLDSIKSGIDRTSNIVQSLSNFSRQNDAYDEECNLADIINNCLSILQYQIKHKCEIIKEYDDTTSIKGNVGKLHQLFLNIISNALHAIDNKGVIKINIERHLEDITIKIIDNGCGIKKENISKITTPFYTTKEPGVGTGLGLSISYNIVKEHKGNLFFSSTENIGTTVVIIFTL